MMMTYNPYNGRRSENKQVTQSPSGVHDESIHDVHYSQLRANSLFKLLENLQWKQAENLIHDSPGEVRQWVIKDSSDRPGWRRLPMHQACILQPPADLIAVLLDAFPSSSQLKDNYDRTPLHNAVIHHASSQVLHLLLDAYYDAKDEQDFFGKTPVDYYSQSIHDGTLSIFSQSKESISTVASKIRTNMLLSSHDLSLEQQELNARYPTMLQNSRVQATDSLQLEEELAQARVEADAAYAQRDVMLAENENMMRKIEDLEQVLKEREQEIEDMQDLYDRNRHLSSLLKHMEEKNQSLQNLVSEKDTKIELLKDELKNNRETKISEANALATRYKQEKEKLMSTVAALSEKLSGMNAHLNETVCELEQSMDDSSLNKSMDAHSSTELQCLTKFKKYAQDKMTSLEEMVDVYKSAANALQVRCNALEQQCSHQKNSTELSSIRMLEDELAQSERIRKALEKEVSLLTSYNIKTNERVEILEEMLNDYRLKLKRLEDGYYQVTEQLIERTMMLCQSQK